MAGSDLTVFARELDGVANHAAYSFEKLNVEHINAGIGPTQSC